MAQHRLLAFAGRGEPVVVGPGAVRIGAAVIDGRLPAERGRRASVTFLPS